MSTTQHRNMMLMTVAAVVMGAVQCGGNMWGKIELKLEITAAWTQIVLLHHQGWVNKTNTTRMNAMSTGTGTGMDMVMVMATDMATGTITGYAVTRKRNLPKRKVPFKPAVHSFPGQEVGGFAPSWGGLVPPWA